MARYILALDQGTTSSRAILFDHGGNVVALSQKEFPQIFPEPGWVEHDPLEIWSTQVGVASETLAKSGVKHGDIAAIGITNQRETTVVWEKRTGKPLYNAIVWQDRRTADFCKQLRDRGLNTIFNERTGLVLDPYFSGTKVRWILDNVPGARKQAEAGELLFGTIDAWLIWKLTGGGMHATDPSNASRTLMYNIHNGAWDGELLDILGVPSGMLPQVADSSAVYGKTLPEFFGGAITIAGIAGDQQAAAFGQACTKKGMAKNTYGTGCFMLLNIGTEATPSENKLLTTVAWKIGRNMEYALEGSVFMAGASVQWLRDGLGIIERSSDVESLASSVPDNGGVFVVPAFAGLGAPHWDPYARGAILGISRATTKAHIARATLESIAYQTADVLEAMQDDSGVSLNELRVDGGASRNDLIMQFQADILGLPVVRPKVTETTALGAAYLAGLAVGFWTSVEEIGSQWQMERRFEPKMRAAERSALRLTWQRALRRAKAWIQA
ncbi:MAG: glycerol kinase GlpK [Deltaproteobacteria bacterium]|jgi:glycerol kinase|nr:glycerol kinase GlpK [Deltaproteobacteria bacterium]